MLFDTKTSRLEEIDVIDFAYSNMYPFHLCVGQCVMPISPSSGCSLTAGGNSKQLREQSLLIASFLSLGEQEPCYLVLIRVSSTFLKAQDQVR